MRIRTKWAAVIAIAAVGIIIHDDSSKPTLSVVTQADASDNPGKLRVYDTLETEQDLLEFAVSKDNPELKSKIDAALEKLTSNGTISKIRMYYSGSSGDKLSYFGEGA